MSSSVVRSLLLACICLTGFAQGLNAAPAANLDQGRNGQAAAPISPVVWVNGNLNSSQAHYIEGYAIPYRLLMTDLPTDGTEIVLTLAYDVTHGGKHALDFLTHFECMEDPSHNLYFGHAAELVDPIAGVPLIGVDPDGLNDAVTDTTAIAIPPGTGTVAYAPTQPAAGFAGNLCDKYITIYGGEFSSDGGPEFAYSDNDGNPQAGDLSAAQSEQLFTIRFKATSPTAVLAWGGHIASRYDWGVDAGDGTPNSASGLSGSPYHMRVIDWNLGNLGNQDRSLSAGAVIALEECDLLGPEIVCHNNSPYAYTVVTDATTFSWSIVPGPAPQYADASIVGTSPDGKTVTVTTPGPNTGFFTLVVTVDAGLPTANTCEYVVEVRANPECFIDGEDGPVPTNTTNLQYSAPAGMDSYIWMVTGDATISGPIDEPTVSIDTGSACDGAFTLTLEIAEGGCSSVCEKTVNLRDGLAPSITCPDPVTIECDASALPENTGLPQVSDNCDPEPVVTYEDSVSLGDCGTGTIARKWTATDASGNSSSCEQLITVVDTTDPMLSAYPADATVECDAIPAAPVLTASDNCTSIPDVGFVETDQRDGACGTGTILRAWTATDCAGNTDVWIQTLTVVDTTDPVLSGYPLDATVECDAIPAPAVLGASDNCDTNPQVAYLATDLRDGGCGTGTILRTWTATDCSGNTDVWTQTLTVVDTTDPVLSAYPADATVECDAIPAAAVLTASDNCDTNPQVAYLASDLRDGGCGTGTILRTWTATDCSGNTDVWTQTLTVVDTTDPVLSAYPADATVECDAIPAAPLLSATDNCSASVPVGFAEVDARDQNCGTGTIARTWTATDCAGNTTMWTQTLTVVDTTKPVITCPDDITIECGDPVDTDAAGMAAATDNCDAAPEVTYEDSRAVSGCGGAITRTWTATDCSGNSASCIQIITLVDTTPPVIVVPPDVEIECDQVGQAIDTGTATATDNCDADPVISHSDVSSVDECGYETITRTWTATDCAGNSASGVQVIAVVDSTPPVITAPPDLIFSCEDEIEEDTDPASTGWATAIDNCDGELQVDYFDEVIGDCPSEIRRTWFATDCAGNTGTSRQRITFVSGNEVTNSSLCIFDRDPDNELEQDFRLLFTPDVKHVPAYKISSTNPGQFFYNVFYLGTPGEEISLEICIPYPFVTQGATPIHAYDWVYLEECEGSVGFVPGDAFYSDKTQITLDDYLPDPVYGTQMCLVGVSFTVPDSGFAYFNIHLDYGLKKEGNYSQDIDRNAFDLDSGTILVPNMAEHVFSVDGAVEGTDSIYNLNDFKGGPGVAGTVLTAGGQPVAGATVVLQNTRERVRLTQQTDASGYYFIPHVRKGKPTVYELLMVSPSGVSENRNVLLKTNAFSVQDFTVEGQ